MAIFLCPAKQNWPIRICVSVCEQFGICYCSTTPKDRYFVEKVTRVTWARQHKQAQERKQPSTQLLRENAGKTDIT